MRFRHFLQNRRGIAAVASLLALLGLHPQPILALRLESGPQSSTVTAYDLRDATVLFQGVSDVTRAGGLVRENTVYSLSDGSTVQRVEAVFGEADLGLVSFQTSNPRTGESESMVRAGGQVRITYREAARAGPQSREVTWRDETAFSSTVYLHVLRNRQLLEEGREITLELLVPSRLGTVRLRLRKEGMTTLEGQAAMVVAVEPESWWIRRLLDPIRIYLAAESPYRLLEYRGLTSVTGEDGHHLSARVVYRYPDGP